MKPLEIIAPTAFAIAIVGLLESLMTASIVDELTDTSSDKNRECLGQGLSNFVTGFIGGMAGCAMIGQSVINIKLGQGQAVDFLRRCISVGIMCRSWSVG